MVKVTNPPDYRKGKGVVYMESRGVSIARVGQNAHFLRHAPPDFPVPGVPVDGREWTGLDRSGRGCNPRPAGVDPFPRKPESK